ncbi:MAG: hypothetical protein ACI8PP_001130 [Candidatus Pseudothioglobus sp.]|jgi:hypothetical protein
MDIIFHRKSCQCRKTRLKTLLILKIMRIERICLDSKSILIRYFAGCRLGLFSNRCQNIDCDSAQDSITARRSITLGHRTSDPALSAIYIPFDGAVTPSGLKPRKQ